MTKQIKTYLYLSMTVNIILSLVIILLVKGDNYNPVRQVIVLSEIVKEEDSTYNEPQKTKTYEIEEVEEKEEIFVNNYQKIINNLSTEEKDLLCDITYLEANNQSYDGQRAVMEVILNRIINKNFPNTLSEVLSQKSQFSTWSTRNSVKDNSKQKEILDLVYSEEPILPNEDYVYFSTSKQSYGNNYIEIDDHWFGEK